MAPNIDGGFDWVVVTGWADMAPPRALPKANAVDGAAAASPTLVVGLKLNPPVAGFGALPNVVPPKVLGATAAVVFAVDAGRLVGVLSRAGFGGEGRRAAEVVAVLANADETGAVSVVFCVPTAPNIGSGLGRLKENELSCGLALFVPVVGAVDAAGAALAPNEKVLAVGFGKVLAAEAAGEVALRPNANAVAVGLAGSAVDLATEGFPNDNTLGASVGWGVVVEAGVAIAPNENDGFVASVVGMVAKGIPIENVVFTVASGLETLAVDVGAVAASDVALDGVVESVRPELGAALVSVDCEVVTGVVMALTVDTTAIGLAGSTTETVFGTSGSLKPVKVGWEDAPNELDVLNTATGAGLVLATSDLSCAVGSLVVVASSPSTWSSSSRSPLRQLNISANFDVSTGRFVNLSGTLAFGLTNEMPASSSSSSSTASRDGVCFCLSMGSLGATVG